MSALHDVLKRFRDSAVSEREKGTYFEELILCYLKNEPLYRDLYSDVWTYAEWAKQQGLDQRDIGIDLVAKTTGTNEFHAIQCKFYAPDHRVQKSDIDSFFTASGKKPFCHRLIITTTNNWNEHASEALRDQQPPVSRIDLCDLENSQIDWSRYATRQEPVLKPKKSLRQHQIQAVQRVEQGLATEDRGKLIMACGTGKTFTSLKITEKLAGSGGRVLFLVPSLSLLSQTLTEWTQESKTPLHNFAVCSDSDVGKKRSKDDEVVQTFLHELRYPATTDAGHLAAEVAKRHDNDHMTVIYSTYHSIETISKAQKDYGLADFDLIICDEAHRTTGATFENDDESAFVRVHNGAFIRSAKRLYMTATPRIYGVTAKTIAERDTIALCSMDDESLYGKDLHVITFSQAVKDKLLVDYKVIVLAMDENHINNKLQNLLKDENQQIKVEDAAKIVGCWKALSKQDTREKLAGDEAPMQRAVAFCQVIEVQHKGKTHKVSSKKIRDIFTNVVEEYKASTDETGTAASLCCEASHIDGSMSASEKKEKLDWLKEDIPDNTCRILSNVRCLSEGVDVPALDAVLFLTPRNSQVDVVQSVGRVMRNAPGKKRGYVILPVVIPAGMEPHEALNDNKTYKVVWQVLQALRSHDDRFDAMINKMDLIGADPTRMEVIAVTDKINRKVKALDTGIRGRGTSVIGAAGSKASNSDAQSELQFQIGEIERAIYAKVVEKCGNRTYWEDWASDIAQIAQTHISRITTILDNENNQRERETFATLLAELQDDLNSDVTRKDVIEMLAQHLITRPVFEALFVDYSFASQNPISQAMQRVLDVLQKHHLEREAETLQSFYDSVKLRAAGIDKAEGKQKIIVELYDKFFRNAFPRMTEKLGIVYTPVEVVDFIIHSVNQVLQREFNQSLGSEGVKILDPFTGTGTFITRLMQSGLLTKDQLRRQYHGGIWANEIVLLAYYIAAVNIEAVYHDIVGGDYVPFGGICLTDTFQMYEKDDLVSQLLVDNSDRRTRQKALDIRVIIGNPPYSTGQGSANDNNRNTTYPSLDKKINETYAARSKATSVRNLYDSYIRAIRWASDRIGNSGVIGFVSGSGFLEKPAMDGMRQCLAEEFSSLHVFNLRGDIRKNMLSKGRAKEGQNVFGSGSMTGIAISILVKNPQTDQQGQIFYHDIGDDLSESDKLAKIATYGGLDGITAANGWQVITPDRHGDWLQQRDDGFAAFIPMGDKDKKSTQTKLFDSFSLGIASGRDSWCYNAGQKAVAENMERMIAFYNAEVSRFHATHAGLDRKAKDTKIDSTISTDPSKISWTRALKQDLGKGKTFAFDANRLIPSLYRPFTKQWLYYDRSFNEMVYQMPRIFPDAQTTNRVIMVSGVGARSGFSALMSDRLPCLDCVEKGQAFPLYLYDDKAETLAPDTAAPPQGELFAKPQGDLFTAPAETTAKTVDTTDRRKRREAMTDDGLAYFRTAYADEKISKEDLFYYIYGLLHSPDYRARYGDNLAKELPRIPAVKTAADFWTFSRAGRALADLHVGYETLEPYAATIEGDDGNPAHYRVEKMRYGKKGKDKDLTTIHYNAHITVRDIPLRAYDYVVNGKAAIDWVVERQGVKTDKASGIVNDANDWALETVGNPRYPLDVLLRVITVSLETLKTVESLPTLEI